MEPNFEWNKIYLQGLVLNLALFNFQLKKYVIYISFFSFDEVLNLHGFFKHFLGISLHYFSFGIHGMTKYT